MLLLIGYGNPGRCDDGLGPAFAERIRERDLPGIRIDVDYQLKVEHAMASSQAGSVVFVDAMQNAPKPFLLTPLKRDDAADFTSHELSPGGVLSLAATLYGAEPKAHLLGISGTEFGRIDEGLSAGATANLDLAEEAFLARLSDLVH